MQLIYLWMWEVCVCVCLYVCVIWRYGLVSCSFWYMSMMGLRWFILEAAASASNPTTKTAGQRPVTVHSEPGAWFIVSPEHGHMRHILSFVLKCQFFCCPPIGWHPEDQGFTVSFLLRGASCLPQTAAEGSGRKFRGGLTQSIPSSNGIEPHHFAKTPQKPEHDVGDALAFDALFT
jgi:hypothetical protein